VWPGVTLTPDSATEACDLVRRAVRDGVRLIPVGAGSRLDLDGSAPFGEARLCSGSLTAIDHDGENQVVTVGAGLPLASLQRVLREHRQWVPLRPPLSDQCTVGGAVALGACGPDRLRYGAPRDLLLGLDFISGRGDLIRAGGRVVKNVAGYDLTRLLAGSRGSLGFLTEVTLRTYPLPEVGHLLEGVGSLTQCASAALSLLDSDLEPVFLTALGESSSQANVAGWRFWVGFEGSGETVDSVVDRGGGALREAGLGSLSGRRFDPGEDVFLPRWKQLLGAGVVIRVGLPPGSVRAFLDGPAGLPFEAEALVDFGSGQLTSGGAAPAIGDLAVARERAAGLGGHLKVERAPADLPRERLGPPDAERELIGRLREALDPDGVFASVGLW
jgi:FAD/FMN-containing dehydrogenase